MISRLDDLRLHLQQQADDDGYTDTDDIPALNYKEMSSWIKNGYCYG